MTRSIEFNIIKLFFADNFCLHEFFESKHAIFFHDNYKIVKIYKKNLPNFPYSDLSQIILNEFEMGKFISPNIYINIINIDSIVGAEYSDISILMHKLPYANRLDNYLSTFELADSDKLIYAITSSIINIFLGRDNLEYYNYFDGLLLGNNRILTGIHSISALQTQMILYSLQSKLENETGNLAENLISRSSRVKRMHGDLSLDNSFYIDGLYCPIDAIGFSNDLSNIDILSQLSDVGSEFLVHGYTDLERKLKATISKISTIEYDEVLYNYYVKRHIFSRLVFKLTNHDESYNKYLNYLSNE